MTDDERLKELGAILAQIHEARPKASLLYARIVLKLLAAPDRTMSVSDLSEALGRGRDSVATQQATEYLAEVGLATREMVPAGEDGGRKWLVQLARRKPTRRRQDAATAEG